MHLEKRGTCANRRTVDTNVRFNYRIMVLIAPSLIMAVFFALPVGNPKLVPLASRGCQTTTRNESHLDAPRDLDIVGQTPRDRVVIG